MKLERRSHVAPLSIETRAEPDEASIGELRGYVARFDSDSVDLGGYTERIRAGAFRESLETNDVVALLNHEHSVVLGRLSAGTLRLSEDDQGLAFSLDLPDTQAGRDLRTLVARKDLRGCSFGFEIEKESWEGADRCYLDKVKLHEVSLGVTFPAYPETSMDLRERRARARKPRVRSLIEILLDTPR